jgi:GTPase
MTFLSGFVAIVGPPNVGKSTILNRFMGSKVAIVSPKPQTTRNRIVGVYHGEGHQIIFVDTPGIHRTSTPLHKSMVESALSAFHEVDILLVVIGADRPQPTEIRPILSGLKGSNRPALLAINKIDTVRKESILPVMAEMGDLYPFEAVIPISAFTGEGVDLLLEQLRLRLKPGPEYFPPHMKTDQSETFLVSEIIREKVYYHTRKELPYSCAVTVDEMAEHPERQLLSILARIHVETDSQKKILIGHQGKMIKGIGQSARKELERRFNTHIYLQLTVRVEKNWSRDTRALRRLGY